MFLQEYLDCQNQKSLPVPLSLEHTLLPAVLPSRYDGIEDFLSTMNKQQSNILLNLPIINVEEVLFQNSVYQALIQI